MERFQAEGGSANCFNSSGKLLGAVLNICAIHLAILLGSCLKETLAHVSKYIGTKVNCCFFFLIMF